MVEVVRGVHGERGPEGRGLGGETNGGVLWPGFWRSNAKCSKKIATSEFSMRPCTGPKALNQKRYLCSTAEVRSVDLSPSRLMPLPPALCYVADMNACYSLAILNKHRVLHWLYGDARNST